jgi:HK97 family phage major capsid protein
MGAPAEFTMEDVRAALKKIGDDYRDGNEKAWAEAKKAGDMSAASKERLDEFFVKQGEIQARLLDTEQKVAKRGQQEENVLLSAGALITQSPEYKAWMDAGGMKSTQSGFVFPMPRAALTRITSTNTTTVGAPADLQPGIIALPQRRLTVRDLLTPGSTTSNAIQYVRETGFTNNAATVSEGDLKPESSIAYDLQQSMVVTIAHWIKAPKQVLDDVAMLQSMIDQRLRYGLGYVEETQLLKGSGVGNNLNGVYTQATTYAAPIALGGSVTMIDTIRLMLLQAEIAEYPSTGIVLHPADWAKIELTKEASRGYIFANPQSLATPQLWGRPVVATQAMTVDTALVGAFKLGAQIFDREDANVVISTENSDDFVRNLVTIRAEERLALAVYRPAAFVKNTNLPAS